MTDFVLLQMLSNKHLMLIAMHIIILPHMLLPNITGNAGYIQTTPYARSGTNQEPSTQACFTFY